MHSARGRASSVGLGARSCSEASGHSEPRLGLWPGLGMVWMSLRADEPLPPRTYGGIRPFGAQALTTHRIESMLLQLGSLSVLQLMLQVDRSVEAPC